LARPAWSAATKPWRSPISTPPLRLEFFLQATVKGTAGSELLREDSDARPITNYILLVPQVEDVEPRLHLADPRQGEWLGDPDVGGLVRLDRRVRRGGGRASGVPTIQKVQSGPGF